VNENPNPQVALLELQRRLQGASSSREVAFRAVNDSAAALRFDQALLWRPDALSRPAIVVASGLADISSDSPYQQWLVRLVRASTPEPFDRPKAFSLGDLPESVAAEGAEWFPGQLLHCPVRGPGGTPLGGLLFFRAEPFSDAERAIAEWIADTLRAEGLEVTRKHHARSVYEYSALDDPDFARGVRRFIEAGEEARFVEHLPLKLVIIDETVVMFGMEDPVGGASELTIVVVEHSALAQVLKIAFDAVWARGLTVDEVTAPRAPEVPVSAA